MSTLWIVQSNTAIDDFLEAAFTAMPNFCDNADTKLQVFRTCKSIASYYWWLQCGEELVNGMEWQKGLIIRNQMMFNSRRNTLELLKLWYNFYLANGRFPRVR